MLRSRMTLIYFPLIGVTTTVQSTNNLTNLAENQVRIVRPTPFASYAAK